MTLKKTLRGFPALLSFRNTNRGLGWDKNKNVIKHWRKEIKQQGLNFLCLPLLSDHLGHLFYQTYYTDGGSTTKKASPPRAPCSANNIVNFWISLSLFKKVLLQIWDCSKITKNHSNTYSVTQCCTLPLLIVWSIAFCSNQTKKLKNEENI